MANQEAKDQFHLARVNIEKIKTHVEGLMVVGVHDLLPLHWKSELRANTKLAYRHLEDARMRLGKAIQAIDKGVSHFEEKDQAGAKRAGMIDEDA